MVTARERSMKKTAQMHSAGQESVRRKTQSAKKEKSLVFKKSPNANKEMQSVLGFPCKKPVRLSPTFFHSNGKTPAKPPAKIPLTIDIGTPEKNCSPPSSIAKPKNKRVAKSLKDVIAEAKNLQASNVSEKKITNDDLDCDDAGSAQLDAKTPKAADFNLPDKYADLAEFFDSMEAAIRLLKLRKTISTFGNICPQVETMTHRRFMHCHVAQMKYIMPEGLLLEKIMLHDEKTLCMKADLKITLLHDALHSAKGRQPFASASKANTSVLRKTFHIRLVEFVQSHPQGDDVPEEILPEPFNKKCQPTPVKPNNVFPSPRSTPAPSPSIHVEDAHPSVMSSLLPESFQRRFSQRTFTAQASPNTSCIPEQDQSLKLSKVTEAGKSDVSNVAIPCSANSHFPAGFKSRFVAKFHPNKISQDNNDLKKPNQIDCPPNFKSSDVTATLASDQSEAPYKVTEAKSVTDNAAKETPLRKTILEFEKTGSTTSKGCFSPATPGAVPDSSPQQTVSVVSSAQKTPANKTLLKSCINSPISKRALHFENVPNSPDAASEQKSKVSKARRAKLSKRSDQNICGSHVSKNSSVHPTSLKRKASESILGYNLCQEFQSTETSMLSTTAKPEAMDNYANSVKHSPSKLAATPSVISKCNVNETNNSICTFQSPTKTMSLEKIQNEKTPEFFSTPPLYPPKRRRLNADKPITPQIKATQSCSQTCPLSIQSLEKGNSQACQVDIDGAPKAQGQTENGCISIQGSCYEGLDVLSQSEREILQTLSPKLVHEVHERQLKNLDDCRLGVLAADRRKQMLACLPKLFNMIRDIFRSSKRSVITRQELVHKIISNHCDVTDRSEVEEQLELLQELVPDWISGKAATSGDFLYSIKSHIDLRSIHAKLVSAL